MYDWYHQCAENSYVREAIILYPNCNWQSNWFLFGLAGLILLAIFGKTDMVSTVFWFTLEGTFVGFIIGYFATKFGGEGKEAIDR